MPICHTMKKEFLQTNPSHLACYAETTLYLNHKRMLKMKQKVKTAPQLLNGYRITLMDPFNILEQNVICNEEDTHFSPRSRIKGRCTSVKKISLSFSEQEDSLYNTMYRITIVLYVIIHMFMAEKTGKILNYSWKKDLTEPKFLFGYKDFLENSNSLYTSKEPFDFEEGTRQVKRVANSHNILRSRLAARDKPPLQNFCSCETQYEIRDLGEGNYPRFLTVSNCKTRTYHGKFNSCILLHYTVHILTERDVNSLTDDNSALLEAPLPEALQQKWRLKRISVPVACVFSSDSRRP